MNNLKDLPNLETLNQQYYSLAASLGDIVFKIKQHDEAIDELIRQRQTAIESIEALNKLAAKINSISILSNNVNLETNQADKTNKAPKDA